MAAPRCAERSKHCKVTISRQGASQGRGWHARRDVSPYRSSPLDLELCSCHVLQHVHPKPCLHAPAAAAAAPAPLAPGQRLRQAPQRRLRARPHRRARRRRRRRASDAAAAPRRRSPRLRQSPPRLHRAQPARLWTMLHVSKHVVAGGCQDAGMSILKSRIVMVEGC